MTNHLRAIVYVSYKLSRLYNAIAFESFSFGRAGQLISTNYSHFKRPATLLT